MIRFIWLGAFVFLAVFSGCQQKHTQQVRLSSNILQSLPEANLRVLESFFEILCCEYPFAYTLFGKKPMSIAYYFSNFASYIYDPMEYLSLEKGWELWKEYSPLFPSNQFVLKKCRDGETFIIFLINKTQAFRVISENLIKFEEILNQKVEPDKFLQQLCDPEENVMKLLNESSELLGILLGYGKVNAMVFERKVNITNYLNAKMTPPFTSQGDIEKLQPDSQKWIELCRSKTFEPILASCSPLSGYESLAAELNDILAREEFFELYGSDFFLDRFISPVFMMRKEDPETQELKKSYLATKLQLRQIYQQGSFLEITLNQWMYPQ